MAQEKLNTFIESLLNNADYRRRLSEASLTNASVIPTMVEMGKADGLDFSPAEIVEFIASDASGIENGNLRFSDADGQMRLIWENEEGEGFVLALPLEGAFSEIFESDDVCPTQLSAVEAIFATGFLAATLDEEAIMAADEVLPRLMLDYGYELDDDQLFDKIEKLYDKAGAGGLFNGIMAALDEAQREHAFAIAVQETLTHEDLVATHSAFIPALARALNIDHETYETIIAWAKKQHEETELKTGTGGAENYASKERDAAISAIDREQFEILEQFFIQDNWPYRSEPDDLRLFTTYQGRNAQYNCVIRIRPGHHQLVCYSLFPQRAPEEKRALVAEFITRANYGAIIGNFELDFSDGEIRYKTSVDYENNGLNEHLIRNIIYPNVLTMDRYISGVFASLYSGKSPAELIAEIERG